ncbi:MAG: hypothetical protein UU36_C0022G0005 [Candidatus Uhrbacteria bacterium GW2011_GWE2_41_1153]|nr:MAG: hypothetical protein UU36_C0022G0005 [Candidatus Uhrbacteria bacterium GW2011_GWE2_41_1153]KKS11282.1 MAG: hypothetical protein UU63_C0010G0004 [Candidatus Uhrbacteria bacterium GW2011_GWF2_41_430]
MFIKSRSPPFSRESGGFVVPTTSWLHAIAHSFDGDIVPQIYDHGDRVGGDDAADRGAVSERALDLVAVDLEPCVAESGDVCELDRTIVHDNPFRFDRIGVHAVVAAPVTAQVDAQ